MIKLTGGRGGGNPMNKAREKKKIIWFLKKWRENNWGDRGSPSSSAFYEQKKKSKKYPVARFRLSSISTLLSPVQKNRENEEKYEKLKERQLTPGTDREKWCVEVRLWDSESRIRQCRRHKKREGMGSALRANEKPRSGHRAKYRIWRRE